MDDARRISGTVKVYRPPGWGFIDQDRGPDLFFRRGDFEKTHTPEPGQRVTYSVVKGPRGFRAVKVKVLDAAGADETNWHEFIEAIPFPLQKLRDDQAESQREKNSSAMRGSKGLR